MSLLSRQFFTESSNTESSSKILCSSCRGKISCHLVLSFSFFCCSQKCKLWLTLNSRQSIKAVCVSHQKRPHVSRTWILCSRMWSILYALGSNELEWETPHLIDNCWNMHFIKPGVVLRAAAATWQRQIGVCSLNSPVSSLPAIAILDVQRCKMTFHSRSAQPNSFSLSLCIIRQHFWEV